MRRGNCDYSVYHGSHASYVSVFGYLFKFGFMRPLEVIQNVNKIAKISCNSSHVDMAFGFMSQSAIKAFQS